MTLPLVFVLKGYPRLSETFIAEEILGLERRGLRHPPRGAAAPDRRPHPSGPRRGAGSGVLPARIPPRCAAPRARRLVAGPPPSGLSRGAPAVLARPAARSLAQPAAPLRPGAGADGRAAGGRGPSPRPFHPHAGQRRRLCEPDRGPALDLFGPCQGHLDLRRGRSRRQARGGALDRDLHARRPRPARRPGPPRSPGAAQPPRSRASTASARWRRCARAATAESPPTRSASSPSAAPSRRRASTRCSTRLALLPPERHWRLAHVGGGP